MMALRILDINHYCPKCGHEYVPNAAHRLDVRVMQFECLFGGANANGEYVAALKDKPLVGIHPLSIVYDVSIPYDQAFKS